MKKSYHFKIIDSTSSYIKKNYKNLNNFTFVSASYQTNGHGRLNRLWESKSNSNLMFSFLIKDKKLINKFTNISLATGAIILNVLKSLGINNVFIKWPNDVYVNDKKICGILLESISNGNTIEMLCVGVGLNVNQKEFEVETATSIYLNTNKKHNLYLLKRKIYKQLIEKLNKLRDDEFDYLSIVKGNNYLLNKEVYAEINNKKTIVRVIDINKDNTLKVMCDNKEFDLLSGEITFHKD